MATRLTLVTHAPTAATRRGAFPDDEEVEPGALPGPCAVRARLVLTGPELRCRRTATALGWAGAVDQAFADLDAGRWRGRSLEALTDDAAGAAAWLADPTAAPHGGESLADLVVRVGRAIDARSWPDGRSVIVTSPLVVRAALVHLLRAPLPLLFAFDVGPSTAVTVSGHGGRWVLRSMRPLRRSGDEHR